MTRAILTASNPSQGAGSTSYFQISCRVGLRLVYPYQWCSIPSLLWIQSLKKQLLPCNTLYPFSSRLGAFVFSSSLITKLWAGCWCSATDRGPKHISPVLGSSDYSGCRSRRRVCVTSPKDKYPASRTELVYRLLLPAPDSVPQSLQIHPEKNKCLLLMNWDHFLWGVGFPDVDGDKGYKMFCQHSFLWIWLKISNPPYESCFMVSSILVSWTQWPFPPPKRW